jgi:hypothetical protein
VHTVASTTTGGQGQSFTVGQAENTRRTGVQVVEFKTSLGQWVPIRDCRDRSPVAFPFVINTYFSYYGRRVHGLRLRKGRETLSFFDMIVALRLQS